MNKLKTSCIAVSLVALLGLASCRKKTQEAEKPRIEKKELIDGYQLIQKEPYRRFIHNDIKNYDVLWLREGNLIRYTDIDCDGIVDKIISTATGDNYMRGDRETDNIFTKADKELEIAKRALGVE